MKKNSLLSLIIICCSPLFGQQQNDNKVRPIAEIKHHYLTFRGDYIQSGISSSSPFTELSAGIKYRNFDAFLSTGKGKITASKLSGFELLNFQSDFSTVDLQFRYKPFRYSNFSPYIQSGIGYTWFSSYSDLKDMNENVYFGWSDGKFRNLPESDFNEATAKEIQRDYVYESALAINQSTVYFPVNLGLEYVVSKHLRFTTGWQFTLLQSDNMDRNTSTAAWDHFQSFQLGLQITFHKKNTAPKNTKTIVPAVNPAIYKDVDFKALLYSDEDQDGVNDMIDQCYKTPIGAVVDKSGCPSDTDGDGVLDFQDKELQSQTDLQIHPDGRAFTLDETQKHYNDSIAMFVKVLRRTSKKSRPYPVRKYIPEENFRKFEKILEIHPEWIVPEIYTTEKMPEDLVVFDLNKDGRIALSEIETMTNKLFDGNAPGMSPEIIQKAITYVFQHQ
jgi:opacity protein-like surface antigen